MGLAAGEPALENPGPQNPGPQGPSDLLLVLASRSAPGSSKELNFKARYFVVSQG